MKYIGNLNFNDGVQVYVLTIVELFFKIYVVMKTLSMKNVL